MRSVTVKQSMRTTAGVAAGILLASLVQAEMVSSQDDRQLETVCSDDFSGTRTDVWQSGTRDWRVRRGVYVVKTSGDEAASALHAGTVLTDGVVAVDYACDADPAASGGLVVRASDDFVAWEKGDAYLFALGASGDAWYFAVSRQLDGEVVYLKEWEAIQEPVSMPVRVKAEFDGDALRFSVGARSVWEGRDAVIASGAAGLFAATADDQKALHTFDAFSLQQWTAPPTAVGLPGESDTNEVVDVVSVPPASEAEKLSDDRSPLLRPGFLVRVSVLVSGRREVDAVVARVDDNSALEFPLVGSIGVKDLTLRQLNEVLQSRYKDFFIDPQVFTEFVLEEGPDAISPWGSVVVLGRVRTPGRVNIPPTQDLTVSGAIQQAGGLDTSAKGSSIRVTRKKPDGGTERMTIDFTAIGTRGRVENDLMLKPGDLIFVPERVF